MAFGLKIPLHGRSHHHTGADPIARMIEFDYDNQGGYLDVTANDADADGINIKFVAVDNFVFQSGGGGSIVVVKPLFLIASGGTSEATVNVAVTPGNYFIVRNVTGGVVEYLRVGDFGTDVKLLSGGLFRVLNESFLEIFSVTEDGYVTAFLASGKSFTVRDSADGEILNVSEDHNVSVNLKTGISLTVNDSGFNPIFRVDEDGSVHIKTGTAIVADL